DELLHLPEVIAALRARFGDGVLQPDGAVDRPAVARVVFKDDAQRVWLEGLLHPRLFARWRELFAADPAANWVVEVPLLFEAGLENWFDFTVCVATCSALQLARLEERGIPRALAEQRISKQLPLARKIEQADFVLSNDGSVDFLRAQVARLLTSLAVSASGR
ncbi:MAG TPA: dephospho-CoA kinase, partial [Opitutaceae bacterium]